MNRFTRAIAMASARHPWRTIATWIAVLAGMFILAGAAGGTFADDFAAKGSQSDRAMTLINHNFPEAAKGKAIVVFEAQDGTTIDTDRSDVTQVLAEIADLDH